MAVKLNSELAAFFNTGDQPSEAEFGHLIDSFLPTPVVLTDSAAVTLTKAANQGRVNVAPDLSQASTYSIPTPAAAGEWYKFIYGGAAEDDHNHIYRAVTTDNSVYFKGGLALIDTDGNSSADFSDGDSAEMITLEDPNTYEINILSTSATVWYLWGWAVSADSAAVAD